LLFISDAIAVNFQPPPNRDDFFKEVSEGVRFGKQRIRNVDRVATRATAGIRTRNRQAADENLNGNRRERENEYEETNGNENEETDGNENEETDDNEDEETDGNEH
jgi:Sec-independent protein translocase protein TatA